MTKVLATIFEGNLASELKPIELRYYIQGGTLSICKTSTKVTDFEEVAYVATLSCGRDVILTRGWRGNEVSYLYLGKWNDGVVS